MLPASVLHPAADLIQSYAEEGIPVNTGPPWSMEALENDIKNGPHV